MLERIKCFMTKTLTTNNELFKTTFFTTMIVGFITHGFFFANLYYIHDNASAAVPVEQSFMGLGAPGGRWLSDYVHLITLDVRLPWLGGIIGIILVAFATYFICDYLRIQNFIAVILLCCVCVANRTLIFSNMFGGLYGFTIALLFASSSLHFFKKGGKGNYLLSIMCATAALSTYGTYVMVMSGIMVFGIALDILDGHTFLTNLKKIGLIVFLHLSALFLYIVCNNTVLIIFGRQYISYNGRENIQSFEKIKRSLFDNISNTYVKSVKRIFRYQINGLEPAVLVRAIVSLALIALVIVVIERWRIIQDKTINLILFLICVFAFPISLNYVELIMSMHFLMDYSYIVVIIAAIKLFSMIDFKGCPAKSYCVISYFLIWVLAYYNILVANMAYVHLDDMYRNTVSLGTRIIDRIETCEGYDGTEQVVLIGDILHNTYYNTQHTVGMPGLDDDMYFLSKERQHVISENGLTVYFLYHSLGAPMDFKSYLTTDDLINSDSIHITNQKEIENMPEFPCDGSVIKRGDIIFAKISQ